MDSPESSNSTTTNCEIAHTEESPVFNFLSNLSPIQTVRAPPATQTFPELSSPPLVFTSPQLNHHRRSAFLQRAQFHRASPAIFANFTGHDEDDNGKYRKLNIQLSTRLEKATDRHSPENDLTGSPAVSPEQFLADIVDAESADPKFSNNSISEKSESIDQPLDIGTVLKENIGNRVRKTISRTSEQLAHVPDVISRQTEEALEENMLLDVNAVEKGTNQVDGVSSDHCREIELTIQTNEDIMTENVEAKQSDHSDESYPFFSGSVEIRKENEILAKATGADLTEPALMRAQKDREAYLHEVLRRCLQFEDSQHKVISSQTAKSILSSEELRLMSSETPATPDNDTHDEVAPPMFRPRNRLNPAIKIPKPSGIGLHLNSIVNAVQAGSGSKVNLRSADWGNFSIVGKKSMHANESHPIDCSNYPTMLPPVENVSAIIDSNRDRHESHASAGVTSPLSVSTHIAKPSDDSDIVSSLEDQSMPGIKRKYTEKGGDSKDFFTSSPQKKRMKASDSGEGGGCKRCNCKKSKCLKLYCDCFASGLYCAEPCACHDCFNTPEYESTVIETRQKIESRDPLAFAPRVVKRVTVQPLSIHGEDGTPSTPSSERHKRGCKCKKSMCLKKYCECYQANVGCSDGCQCEGCQNVFGQKGGMSTQKSILALREEHCPVKNVFCEEDTIEVADGAGLEKRIITASGNLVNPTEVFNTHHLTPPTPAFQSSNRRKDASKSWFPSQSRETGFTSVAPYMIAEGSPLNSDDINNSMATEDTRELLLDLSSFGNDSQTNLQKCADDSLYKKRQIFPLGSTNMPLPHYSGTKLDRDVKFDSDDTPEMLKESSTFITGVKICSPNKKRVSPPHAFGSISLAGIRTGRKFILKSVPTFPPLTPCIDSRSVAVDKSNEPQNHHVNNDACI